MLGMGEIQKKRRLEELKKIDSEAAKQHEKDRKNSNFTQVSPKGWERVRELSRDKQGSTTIPLYTFLAENIDASCGAVVADQQFLADHLKVSTRTIIRWLNYLESVNAVIRIPVAGRVCAYALDPHEVWKGYNTSKNYAAFITKTLVNHDGDIKRKIMAMFKGQETDGDAKDQQDLDLE